MPSFELKFLLTESNSQELESRLGRWLLPDPHGNPELGNSYLTQTLYCDTSGMSVLKSIGRHAHRKYRIRRYGTQGPLFLERKTKRGRKVRKRRTAVGASPFGEVLLPPRLDPIGVHRSGSMTNEADWFRAAVDRHNLWPTCQVQYVRKASYGFFDTQPVRVTFDRNVCGVPAGNWRFVEMDSSGGREIHFPFGELVIAEIKFRGHLSSELKTVLHDLGLTPTPASKYRRCLTHFLSSGWSQGDFQPALERA